MKRRKKAREAMRELREIEDRNGAGKMAQQ